MLNAHLEPLALVVHQDNISHLKEYVNLALEVALAIQVNIMMDLVAKVANIIIAKHVQVVPVDNAKLIIFFNKVIAIQMLIVQILRYLIKVFAFHPVNHTNFISKKGVFLVARQVTINTAIHVCNVINNA